MPAINLLRQQPLLAYLIALNLLAFFSFGLDKLYARAGAWRVREITLLMLALLGGSLGALLGIQLFRHKTKKASFMVVLALIFLGQMLLWWWYRQRVGGAAGLGVPPAP